jgi:hypothetical protein
LALLIVDRTLQYYDRQDAARLLAMTKNEQAEQQRALYEEYKDKPMLKECTVKVAYKMGGTHGLPNVTQGQVLQVLQEGIGPQGHYAMCRTLDEQGNPLAIGWYPMSFLEPIKKSWWRRL